MASAADLSFVLLVIGLECTEPCIAHACRSVDEIGHAMTESYSLMTKAYHDNPETADGVADSSVVAERDSVSLRSTVKNKVLT